MRCSHRYCRQCVVISCLLATISAGAGCTTTYTARRTENLPVVPLEGKVPIRLGLYMQPQVREYTTATSGLRLKPGGSLGEGIEALMRSLFSGVFLLGSMSSANSADLDAILMVDILGSDFDEGYGGYVYNILVGYTVTDLEGRILWSESILGTGKRSFAANLIKRVYSDCMRLAIEDNLDNTLASMMNNQWWRPLLEGQQQSPEGD